MKSSEIIYGGLAPFLYAMGFLGCFANLAFLRGPKFKNRFYFYLKSLAISDLGFIIFIIPYFSRCIDETEEMSNSQTKRSLFALLYVKNFELAIINGFLAASVFIVVNMTIDR